MNVHYVIAAYLGPRGFGDEAYEKDPWRYVNEHLETLSRLKHHLDVVTVVVNSNDPVRVCPVWLDVHGVPVRMVFRENTGMSYGSFAEIYSRERDYFDRFIFMEDDYVFTQDHFDEYLLQKLGAMVGMVCGSTFSIEEPGSKAWMQVAAVFAGMASRKALDAAALRSGGRLPAQMNGTGYLVGCNGQKAISKAIVESGYLIKDWLDDWSTAYRNGHGREVILRWFGAPDLSVYPDAADPRSLVGKLDKPAFIVPVQAIDRLCTIDTGVGRFRGIVRRDGTVEGVTKLED